MDESTWLASNDPAAMMRLATGSRSTCCGCLWCDNGNGTTSLATGQQPCSKCDNSVAVGYSHLVSDRKLRLFVCAVARALGLDRDDIVKAERMADGQKVSRTSSPSLLSSSDARHSAVMYCHQGTGSAIAKRRFPPAQRAALLREIVGNPFRPVEYDRLCGIRNQGAVIHIARKAYDERPGRTCPKCDGVGGYCEMGPNTFHQTCTLCHGDKRIEDGTLCPDTLGVLADALEDAGCDNEVLLMHLRGFEKCRDCHPDFPDSEFGGGGGSYWCPRCGGTQDLHKGDGWAKLPTPHVRGCWALDLILGKE